MGLSAGLKCLPAKPTVDIRTRMKCYQGLRSTSKKGSTLMPYRVSLESGVDEAIEEVDCEDWAAVHAVLDKWHSQVHSSQRYIMVSAFEKRFVPRTKIPDETDHAQA
jgi:hypothetical protein